MISMTLLCVLNMGSGCFQGKSDGPDLFMVTGTVTVDNEPLPLAVITFDPEDGIAGSYGGEIRNGTYSFRSAAGPKKVTIMASRPSNNLGPDGLPGMEQYLSERYNMKTELTANVVAGEKNAISFQLQTAQ
ncbi:MAG TPA: hypothetical protein VNQ76_00255 [Planctomicrobium sp.]|nr:hypothetical protein [Planctomicrobium sp.]